MATYFSVLARRIPWTEKPGGLQSIGSWRISHSWSDLTNTYAFRVSSTNACKVDSEISHRGRAPLKESGMVGKHPRFQAKWQGIALVEVLSLSVEMVGLDYIRDDDFDKLNHIISNFPLTARLCVSKKKILFGSYILVLIIT